jgi:hypothetical protein
MFVVLAMSAFSIDLATWYQKRHQAQVAADAAALAAANCLANGKTTGDCKSATDTTDAINVASNIASSNGVPLNSTAQVNVNTVAHTVTVVTMAHPQVDFAGLMNVHPTVMARSISSYTTAQANYSVFVANPTCTTGSGLQIGSFGGGNATVNGLYSDGVIDNNDDSGSALYSGAISNGQQSGGFLIGGTPQCGDGQGNSGSTSNDNLWQTKNTTVVTGSEKAYPWQYDEPALVPGTTITSGQPSSPPTNITPGVCTYSSTYFSTDGTGTHQIRWPGIYCVTDDSGSNIATAYSGTGSGGQCTANTGNKVTSDDTPQSIYINSTLQGAYEFVGPCVVGDSKLSSSISAVSNSPLIYGTAESAYPCLEPPAGQTLASDLSNNFVNPAAITSSPDNVYLYNNNLNLNATVYAPCGTVEMYKNNTYDAFLEAANVTIDKNNFTSWLGTGPSSAPATDGLTG